MNRDEAKQILAGYRPGGQDAADPMFRDAFKLMESDPELKGWFDKSVAFDRAIATKLSNLTAPAGLREAILFRSKVIQPVPWWHRKLSVPQLAAAAAILLILTFSGAWAIQRPVEFADFKREIVDRSWGAAPHLELETKDITQVRRFLAGRNAPFDFEIPPILADSIGGCRIVQWRGRRVPVICFASGDQHFHMIVAEGDLFRDGPRRLPEVDGWEAWRTASWSKNGQTYVLTGLSPTAFFKKFRKSRHWDWEG